jgi:hypothetical protein
VRAGRRLRSDQLALIGVVLLALGIGLVAGAAPVVGRLPLAGAAWVAALLFFLRAHGPWRSRRF